VNDELAALLRKARRYLDSAVLLKNDGDYDSAASRLYYAMFYCAEALLLTKDVTRSSHGGVIAAFGEHLVRTGDLPQEMHRWLLDGFSSRQLADYQPAPVTTETDVVELEHSAVQFVEEATKYLTARGFP
jgi:uncharacterized protein (UPF0332 family)